VCGFEPRPVQSVQNYQTKKHVHEPDMTGDIYTMRFNVKTSITHVRRIVVKKTHMEKTKNPIYDYYRDAKKKNRDI